MDISVPLAYTFLRWTPLVLSIALHQDGLFLLWMNYHQYVFRTIPMKVNSPFSALVQLELEAEISINRWPITGLLALLVLPYPRDTARRVVSSWKH